MRKIALDLGNTRWKARLRDEKGVFSTAGTTVADLNAWIEIQNGPQTQWAVAAVNEKWRAPLAQIPPSRMLEIGTHLTAAGLVSQYQTQKTLGVDRWCNAVGAAKLYPGKTLLVVDLGTCIKYDLVHNGVYKGGGISPGMAMRFQSMGSGAHLLKEESFSESFPFIGATSQESLQSGVQQGICFEIDGYMDKLQTQYPGIIGVITGGDSGMFEKALKNSFFAVPELTLIGIDAFLD